MLNKSLFSKVQLLQFYSNSNFQTLKCLLTQQQTVQNEISKQKNELYRMSCRQFKSVSNNQQNDRKYQKNGTQFASGQNNISKNDNNQFKPQNQQFQNRKSRDPKYNQDFINRAQKESEETFERFQNDLQQLSIVSYQSNYAQANDFSNLILILKKAAGNQINVNELLNLQEMDAMMNGFSIYLKLSQENTEKYAYFISQIKVKEIQQFLSKILIKALKNSLSLYTNHNEFLKIFSRMLNVHKLKFDSQAIHYADTYFSEYLEQQYNKLQPNFLQTTVVLIQELRNQGLHPEMRKLLSLSLKLANKILDQNPQIRKTDDYQESICKVCVLFSELAISMPMNDLQYELQCQAMIKIVQYLQETNISSLATRPLIFATLCLGKNSVYAENVILNIKQEVVKRHKNGKLTFLDFQEFISAFQNLSIIDEKFLQDMGISDCSYIEKYSDQLQIKHKVNLAYGMLAYAEILPQQYFKANIDFFEQIVDLDKLHILDIKIICDILEYLSNLNYFEDQDLKHKLINLRGQFIARLDQDTFKKWFENRVKVQQSIDFMNQLEERAEVALREAFKDEEITSQYNFNNKFLGDFYLNNSKVIIEVQGPHHYLKKLVKTPKPQYAFQAKYVEVENNKKGNIQQQHY